MEFTVFATMNEENTLIRQFGITEFDRGYDSISDMVKDFIRYQKDQEDFDLSDEIRFIFDIKDVVIIWGGACWRDLPLDENERSQFYIEMLKAFTSEIKE